MPSISNFRDGRWDSALIQHLLSDPVARAAHITAISTLVQTHGWAGVDLDYESLPNADRDAYSRFIQELSSTLHRMQKRLSVTVHAKTSEPGDWSGAQAEHWQALGAWADEIRVMAYDYATEQTAPGPIAPLSWVERVLRLAVAEIPRHKVLLGVGAYGYTGLARTKAHLCSGPTRRRSPGIMPSSSSGMRAARRRGSPIPMPLGASIRYGMRTRAVCRRRSVWHANIALLECSSGGEAARIRQSGVCFVTLDERVVGADSLETVLKGWECARLAA
jgi:hypothetical protein